jgi:hypothetical protein
VWRRKIRGFLLITFGSLCLGFNPRRLKVVSSMTLPIAGSDFLAAFRDDPLQFGAFSFRQNSSTSFDCGEPFRPAGFAETVDVVGGFFQLGRWQSLQIFYNNFQSAHVHKIAADRISDKSVSNRRSRLYSADQATVVGAAVQRPTTVAL